MLKNKKENQKLSVGNKLFKNEIRNYQLENIQKWELEIRNQKSEIRNEK